MAKRSKKNTSSLWWKGDPVFGVSVPPRTTQYDQVEGQFGPGLAVPAINRRNAGRPRRRAKKTGLTAKQLAAGFGGVSLMKAARAGKLKPYKRGAAAAKKASPKRTYRRESAGFREWQHLGPTVMQRAHAAARRLGISPRGPRWAKLMSAEAKKVSGRAGVRDARKGKRKAKKGKKR